MLLLDIIHYIITIFCLFGWIIPNCYVLVFHASISIVVIIHWITNNNECILSQLNNESRGEFTKNLLSLIGVKFDLDIDKYSLYVLSYTILSIIVIISLYRIYSYNCL